MRPVSQLAALRAFDGRNAATSAPMNGSRTMSVSLMVRKVSHARIDAYCRVRECPNEPWAALQLLHVIEDGGLAVTWRRFLACPLRAIGLSCFCAFPSRLR